MRADINTYIESMSEIQTNRERELAKEFVLNTRKNVFLTGKAGTGKTTLLKEILKETYKNYIVAAPTGVAAINAGGVTLHSLLTIPLRTFIPYRDKGHSQEFFFDGREMVKHQKFNRKKLDLLLELELMVIDEISMVRADIFDAIDQTLRRVRKIDLPFGGVQILVIGDLYQLSPVVRQPAQEVLSLYYKSPYFFDSLVWKSSDAVTIELTTVYRQEEQQFIDILNSIRSGSADQSTIDSINENYAEKVDYTHTITLTTHNKKADTINQSELDKLDTVSKMLEAEVSGRFYENSYPNDASILLKIGAQVMYIRNHSEGLYYNGKMGTVVAFDQTSIKVKGDDGITIIVEPAEWKNMSYEIDPESGNIVQNEVGSYIQYPLRLAWAVTVHKSQGLTFDKVILDLEDTFASGQLYVALSRCRSLEGLVLTSKISEKNVITDRTVAQYSEENQLPDHVDDLLKNEIKKFNNYKIQKEYSLSKLVANVATLEQFITDNNLGQKANRMLFFKDLESTLMKLSNVSETFQKQLALYFDDPKIDDSYILKRLEDAIHYFVEQIHTTLLIPSIKHAANYVVKEDEKSYVKALEAIEEACWSAIEAFYNIIFNDKQVHLTERKYIRTKPSKTKKVKGETYQITYEMHQQGKSIGIIAKERGLAIGTIETHFAKLIGSQRISIFEVMKEKKVEKGIKILETYPDLDSTELLRKLPFKASYGELRYLKAHQRIVSDEGG